jgi:hypothetical protein
MMEEMLTELLDAGFVLGKQCTIIMRPGHGPALALMPDNHDDLYRCCCIMDSGEPIGSKSRTVKGSIEGAHKHWKKLLLKEPIPEPPDG